MELYNGFIFKQRGNQLGGDEAAQNYREFKKNFKLIEMASKRKKEPLSRNLMIMSTSKNGILAYKSNAYQVRMYGVFLLILIRTDDLGIYEMKFPKMIIESSGSVGKGI